MQFHDVAGRTRPAPPRDPGGVIGSERSTRMRTTTVAMTILGACLALAAGTAEAGCGCDKPPPPRAAVRPFVASADQHIMLFDAALDDGKRYDVLFESMGPGGPGAWSQGKSRRKRDIADGQMRPHLRVRVPELPLGPTRISVYRNDKLVFAVGHQVFTTAGRPIPLEADSGSVVRRGYRAAVGADGTLYIPVDVSRVSGGTRFWGTALDLPIQFQASNVAMYNTQGYLMQLLDPTVPGLFELYAGDQSMSTTLAYWRHEFRTWKDEHFRDEHFLVDEDPDWHASGSRHVDHDVIVVAVRGQLADGRTMPAGATPPFQLVVTSEPDETPTP